MTKLYTGRGDDGTTGLFHGGRVRKDDARPEAVGAVDEAQAAVGLARAATERGGELDRLLVELEHDLYVLMAELATAPERRDELVEGRTAVPPSRVGRLEALTDDFGGRFEFPTEFVVPGQSELSARLDVARTAVRRAERRAVAVADTASHVVPYLNRLSSVLWTLARWAEAGDALPARTALEEP
jgi:cob(I)alamin adenosyltransferase